ncbi:MAG: hypothetical protein ACT4QF_20490 [Sporichthyaceae bacterium]
MSAVVRWEYARLIVRSGSGPNELSLRLPGRDMEPAEGHDWLNALNALGQEGWEVVDRLIMMSRLSAAAANLERWEVLLKRPVE